MAVSGAHWRKQIGERSSIIGEIQEYGRLEPTVSIQSIEAIGPTRLHVTQPFERVSFARSTDNSHVQVPDDPVKPRDEADSGPPAIEVAAESADVAQEPKLTSNGNRRATRSYFDDDSISLRDMTPASDGYPCAVIVE